MENQFDKINLEDLLYNSKIPDEWHFKYNLNYSNIPKLIEKMSLLDLPNSNLVKAIAALTNNHDYATSIRKIPTTFIRKTKKIKDKSEMNLPVLELKNDDNIKESNNIRFCLR